MHATLLTVLLVAGADPVGTTTKQPPVAAAAEGYAYAAQCGQRGYVTADCRCGAYDTCNSFSAWFGPMPQTCYAPRFGCYPGNNRHMHRYPAFHGYYYRQPYNYRHLFDYPWHAAPHKPQGYSAFPCQQTAGNAIYAPQGRPGTAAGPLQPVPSSPAMPDPSY